MFILSLRKIIGLSLFVLGLTLAIVPFHSAFADNWNDPSVQYGTSVTRNDPVTFNATDGNQRLELKARADIERASAPTVHTDTTVNSDYMCDWSFDKVLGRWVCEKDYMRAYQYTHPRPIPVCPFGWKLNYGGSDCVRILYPQYAHLNSRGDGWECNAGYHVNLTGTVCLSSRYVYQQCPGGSFNCGSSGGCQRSYAQPVEQPILAAVPIVVNQIVNVNISNGQTNSDSDSDGQVPPQPKKLPSTGPSTSILIPLLGLSVLGVRKLLIKV
jgi:hypothetical protein